MYLYTFIYGKTQYYKMLISSKFMYKQMLSQYKWQQIFNENRKTEWIIYGNSIARLANNLTQNYKVQKLNIKHKFGTYKRKCILS